MPSSGGNNPGPTETNPAHASHVPDWKKRPPSLPRCGDCGGSVEKPGYIHHCPDCPRLDPEPAECFHPIEYVLEELEHRGISPDMAGRMLLRSSRISLVQWFEFIAGGPVNERLADGLGQLFGTGSEVWLKLQRAYDRMYPGTDVEPELIDGSIPPEAP